MPDGIFILAELTGPVADRIRLLNEKYDPRLAAYKPPHVTITGSSGAGPIPADTSVERIRIALQPVAASTPPLTLQLGAASRFMQTNIIVLPLDRHGPLRRLHERIVGSGLLFARARYTFSPHCTLSLYRTLDSVAERELLGIRINEPVTIDAIQVYHTRDPQPSRKLLQLPLTGERTED